MKENSSDNRKVSSYPHQVTVRFFSTCREITGKEEEKFPIGDSLDIGEFLREVFRKYPALEPLQSNLLVAVNYRYTTKDYVLQAGDEVAILPPFAGG